jgi:V/A-type H+-transporting ATPase subunit I
MPWGRELWPAPMRRVAVVAPSTRARQVLGAVADCGTFEPDAPRGSALDGEGSFDAVLTTAQHPGRCVVVPGWIRDDDLLALRARIVDDGGAVADLPGRRGLVPPTAHVESRSSSALRPLVTTYATVPYRDIDPTWFAAVVYVLMFGMMFGDVAHGLGIVVLGVVALRSQGGPLEPARRMAPFLVGAGAAAACFGLLYGDAFGPTGLVPTLWIRPLDDPEQLLVAGLILGGVLLAITFALSIVNRWREGGFRLALYDPSGIPGAVLLLAVGGAAAAVATSTAIWWWWSAMLAVVGTLLVLAGLLARSGGSGSGIAEAVVELFDTLLRLGSNIVSFTRLAAFGLTHAVITEVVWDGSVALWERSVVGMAAAVLLFLAGNLAAFALGALVAAIQALRLEYYELFSRLFAGSGRPFTPWHVPIVRSETP